MIDKPLNTNYDQGYIDGLTVYAINKDGQQIVGALWPKQP